MLLFSPLYLESFHVIFVHTCVLCVYEHVYMCISTLCSPLHIFVLRTLANIARFKW